MACPGNLVTVEPPPVPFNPPLPASPARRSFRQKRERLRRERVAKPLRKKDRRQSDTGLTGPMT